MYIPDLFGAYIKGRELAIEKNWQDLKNYESVQNSRLQNDLTALDLLGRRADFAGNRAMHNYQVNSASRADRIGEIAQPGMEAMTGMRSNYAIDQADVFSQLRPDIKAALLSTAQAQVGKQQVAAGVQRATNEYWTPERQWDAGQAQGQVGYNTVVANGVASTDYVPAAHRQIAQNKLNYDVNRATGQYQLGEVRNAISNQPTIHELGKIQLGNRTYDATRYIADREAQAGAMAQGAADQAYREYIAYLQAAQAGDQVAAQAAAQLAQRYGFAPPATTVTPTSAGTTTTTTTTAPKPLASIAAPSTAVPNVVRPLIPSVATLRPYPVAPSQGFYMPTTPRQLSYSPDVWATYPQAANYTGP